MPLHVDLGSAIDRGTAVGRLRDQGFCTLTPAALATLAGASLSDLDAMKPFWDRLPPDMHLKDGGHYRYRRHSCFVQGIAPASLQQTPHRAHWQPTTYNALHGGMERWFEPMEPAQPAMPAWQRLLTSLGALFAEVSPQPRWYIEAHPFRIDTNDGVGRPTPEGAHRDGVDFVAVILIGRHAVRGGETRVFEAQGPLGVRFTLEQPWTALLLDDARVIHESTPIQPLLPGEGERGWRDTLVLTYRAGSFQEPGTVR